MGLAEHALLAQVNRVKQADYAIRACLQAIANIALLEIDLKVAPARQLWRRYQKGTDLS
jgi:hypothetical protein